MIHFLFTNARIIQILWTTIAIVGFGFAANNFLSSNRVVDNLARENDVEDEVELRVSRSLRMTELMRVTVQSIFISIGAISFFTPTTILDGLPLRIQVFAYALRWGLVFAAMLTAAQSINLFYLRRYFTRRDEQ